MAEDDLIDDVNILLGLNERLNDSELVTAAEA